MIAGPRDRETIRRGLPSAVSRVDSLSSRWRAPQLDQIERRLLQTKSALRRQGVPRVVKSATLYTPLLGSMDHKKWSDRVGKRFM